MLEEMEQAIQEDPRVALEPYNGSDLPIHIAVREQKWELVAWIATVCPETVLSCQHNANPILHTMLYQQVSSDIVKQVIEACPSASTVSSCESQGGSYALHVALEQQTDAAIVDLLLDISPQVLKFFDTANGHLPLHVAVKSHARKAIVQRMLALYPEAIEECDFDGRLPLHIAVESECPWSMLQLLVEHEDQRDTLTILDTSGFLPIHIACLTHTWDSVNHLARLCPETINERDPLGDLPIHVAVASQAWDTALTLIQNCPQCTCIPDRCDRLPLHVVLASFKDIRPDTCKKLVDALIEAYPSAVRYQNNCDSLPVHQLIHLKQWELVERVVNIYPECVLATNRYGSTTFMLAAKYGAPPTVISCLATACSGSYDFSSPESPLDLALKHAHWKTSFGIVTLFPDQASMKNSQRLFPIQIAILQNCPIWMITKLCAAYPQAAAQLDGNGNTMAHAAVLSRKSHLITQLVQAYPTVASIPDKEGKFLFETAMAASSSSDVVVEIVKAFPQATTKSGVWCLDVLLDKFRLAVDDMDLLINSDAFLTLTDEKGNSPLHLAVQKSNLAFASKLLYRGINTFSLNDETETAFDLAARSRIGSMRNLLRLESLVKDKKWLTARGAHGQTPLFHAIAAGNIRAVRMMLQNDADPSIVDDFNCRPIDVLPKHMVLSELHSEIALAAGQSLLLHDRYIYNSKDHLSSKAARPAALDILTGRYVHLNFFNDENEWMQAQKRMARIQVDDANLMAIFIDAFSIEEQGQYVIATEAGSGRCVGDLLSSRGPISRHECFMLTRLLFQALHLLQYKFNSVHARLSDTNVIEIARGCYKLTDTHWIVSDGDSIDLPSEFIAKHQRFLPPEGTLRAQYAMNIWTAGVLTYEIFSRTTLGRIDSYPILIQRLEETTQLPNEVKRLLQGVLHPDADKRSTIDAILNDPFFEMDHEFSLAQEETKILESLPISVADIVLLTLNKQKNELNNVLDQLREQTKYSECVVKTLERPETNKKPRKKKVVVDKYMGRRIEKEFDDGIIYRGQVTSYRDGFWGITYEDGDTEELDEKELIGLLVPQDKLRGRFAKSKTSLHDGQVVYIAEDKKLLGSGRIVGIPQDDEEIVFVRLEKIFTGTPTDEMKRKLLQQSGKCGFIRWDVKSCFVPKV